MTEDLFDEGDLALARGGDAAAFTRLVRPLRRELHAHCYRMLGSVHDADDALQDALLRAWRALAGFEGRASLRTWLYTVATRSCLKLVEARGRRALPMDLGPASERAATEAMPLTEVAWLSPCPDAGLAAEQREGIELAFVAALQHLPGNQRAALLLFEVLGFSVAEIATMMKTSSTSVNSALARARRLVAQRVPPRGRQRAPRELRQIATSFADAIERGDAEALVALLTKDVTWSMPPLAQWYQGIDAVMDFAVKVPLTLCPSFRHEITSANGWPAVAFYVGAATDAPHDAWSITVLTLREDLIVEIVSFLDPGLFARFGLPAAAPDRKAGRLEEQGEAL